MSARTIQDIRDSMRQAQLILPRASAVEREIASAVHDLAILLEEHAHALIDLRDMLIVLRDVAAQLNEGQRVLNARLANLTRASR
jgi:hypothetical protein